MLAVKINLPVGNNLLFFLKLLNKFEMYYMASPPN